MVWLTTIKLVHLHLKKESHLIHSGDPCMSLAKCGLPWKMIRSTKFWLLTRFATRYGRTFTVLEDDGKKIPREKIAPYEKDQPVSKISISAL
jgi:hypothetical protein